jgi:hypothetical protein
VKVLPTEHTCPSTIMVDGKIASKSWVFDREGGWLRKHITKLGREGKLLLIRFMDRGRKAFIYCIILR